MPGLRGLGRPLDPEASLAADGVLSERLAVVAAWKQCAWFSMRVGLAGTTRVSVDAERPDRRAHGGAWAPG